MQKEVSFQSSYLHMKKSGLHLKISSLLILTLLIFMKLYQEVVDFNTVAPCTLNQFSLISIGFFHPSTDVTSFMKTCSQGPLEHMSGVRGWSALPATVWTLGAPRVDRDVSRLSGPGCLLNPFIHKATLPSSLSRWGGRQSPYHLQDVSISGQG